MNSTLLDPPPVAPSDDACDGVAELHALLDRLHETRSPIQDHARQVAEIDRAIHRLTALKLKVLADADTARVATAAGYADTNAWTARHTRTSRTTAARDVALATDLQEGHDTTAAALDEGLLSPAHAAVIVQAAQKLPEGCSDDQRAEVEAVLVAKARRFDPDQLRRVARRAIETIEPDQAAVDAHENQLVADEEEAARARCSLSLHDNDDGTTTGHFTIPTVSAAFLRTILESMTAPRRMRRMDRGHLVSTGSTDGASGSTNGGPGPTSGPISGSMVSTSATNGAKGGRGHFDWKHRRGLAFAELLEHLPTDHLHTKTAATVVVTVDHNVLTGALKTARLDTGDQVSAGEARRLACSAGILPAVLGGRSVALDLGRETRLFSESQRIALGLRHHTCAAEGCQRPYAWCELHHRQPWSTDGPTNLDNAIPLCHWHHQRIHHHSYSHRTLPDGSIRFARRC